MQMVVNMSVHRRFFPLENTIGSLTHVVEDVLVGLVKRPYLSG